MSSIRQEDTLEELDSTLRYVSFARSVDAATFNFPSTTALVTGRDKMSPL